MDPIAERQIHLDRALVFYDYVRIEGWLYPRPEELESLELRFDGSWVHTEKDRIGVPSPDISLHPNCRFVLTCLRAHPGEVSQATLTFKFRLGSDVLLDLFAYTGNVQGRALGSFLRFLEQIKSRPGASVLEIGSRARSGNTQHYLLEGAEIDYVGCDIKAGENVDVVADAHEMSGSLGHARFDFAFSLDVFEHLAMPWKVVLELNRVMKTGGLVYIATPQTCGLHDMPWDFWRFSDSAFRALFNPHTGFELVETSLLLPMHILPFHTFHPIWANNENAAGFFQAEVLARKIGDTRLSWDVPLEELVEDPYPA